MRTIGLALALASGCGGPATEVPDAPVAPAGAPSLGAHTLAFQRYQTSPPPTVAALETPAIATRATGSTLVVGVGRGQLGAFALPTDSLGNAPYKQEGEAHPYTLWPTSGTALYTFASATGGTDHTVRVATPVDDEVTLAVVEVVDGARVVDAQWAEVLRGAPLTSPSVTTTGPAVLVAFWWGDADVTGEKTATPDQGFAVTDAVLEEGALVQGAVAVKAVTEAGTYDVTWTATPAQGAQLWLVAVQ